MDRELLTAARMRALETAAIELGAVAGRDLMERAGRGAVAAILAEWPDLANSPGRTVVLCGPGNNGGDGFVVARLLAERGWEVTAFLLGDAGNLPPDARANHERWCAMGPVHSLADNAAPWGIGDTAPDLVIDALFGTGLSRPFIVPEALNAFFHRSVVDDFRGTSSPSRPYVVALDILSGVDADSGRELMAAGHVSELGAHLTVTFHTAKPGHYLGHGPGLCGKLAVVDIGLAADKDLDRSDGAIRLVGAPVRDPSGGPWVGDKARAFPGGSVHKYDHGHALVLAGGMGRTGAARLAARGALRIGAGLVTVAAPGGALMECATQLTAIMLRRCDDGEALEALLKDARLNALCLGPGLGTYARGVGLVEAAIVSGRALVLDADALTLLAGRNDPFAGLPENCVLTPHAGEFARLFPDLADALVAPATEGPAFSKLDATRAAAARAGCVVLFKGPDTVIAAPSGAARVHAAAYDRTTPWLASAGTGDVLAGMVTGLLARGLAPMDAAASAAWCHVEAAHAFGPGLIAEDLPEALPAVLRALQTPTSSRV